MKVLCIYAGGIGNVMQAIPATRAIASEGHVVDVYLQCDSEGVEFLLDIPEINNVFTESVKANDYDCVLKGPFSSNIGASKDVITSKINFAQHVLEVEVYYDMAKRIGVKATMEDTVINVGDYGYSPPHGTVAIYPGSKSNWAMKRWDKYDELSKHYDQVLLVGTHNDIDSTGDPPWFKKKWKWGNNVEKFFGTLQETAFAISQCSFFIGNDGGLSHVAAATGIPTFVLFGPSSVIKNTPYSKKAFPICIDMPCRPCQFRKGIQYFGENSSNCPHHMACLSQMTVPFVKDKIKGILETLEV